MSRCQPERPAVRLFSPPASLDCWSSALRLLRQCEDEWAHPIIILDLCRRSWTLRIPSFSNGMLTAETVVSDWDSASYPPSVVDSKPPQPYSSIEGVVRDDPCGRCKWHPPQECNRRGLGLDDERRDNSLSRSERNFGLKRRWCSMRSSSDVARLVAYASDFDTYRIVSLGRADGLRR